MAGAALPPIVDAPLFIVPRVLDGLRAYRAAFAGLPDAGRLTAHFEHLQARLLAGIERHPTRFWVLTQCRQTLDALDALGHMAPAVREQALTEIGKLMAILGIDGASLA